MKTRQIIIFTLILAIGVGILCSASAKTTTTKTQKYTNKTLIKQKASKIIVTAKPSCGCKYKYKWYKRSYYNWCPNCKRINCLLINPKGVYEKEATCKYCDCDYCLNCGKEKMYRSSKYLIKC